MLIDGIIVRIFIFIFGLIVGSFLNAVIYRLEINKSAFRGRSFCPKCKHTLAWRDLAPLFSFVLLRGKCRYCHQKISVQYPLVELLTALLFTTVFEFRIFDFEFVSNFEFRISNFLGIFYWFYIISVLIIIFVYDLKHYIIPDKIVLPAIVVSLIWIWSIGNYLEIGNSAPLIAAFGAAGFFFALILISKGKWMGFGDVKLAFFMGIILGIQNVVLALFTAFTMGAIIGLVLIFLKKKTLKSQIPFGPFLVVGTIIALFFGNFIVNWYLNILL